MLKVGVIGIDMIKILSAIYESAELGQEIRILR